MHTVIVVGVGLVVLGACLLVGYALGAVAGVTRAALVFLPLWLVGAAINLLIGVRSAGYPLADEAPVFVLVFAVPAAVAVLIWWRLH
jgi:hypothetical protein